MNANKTLLPKVTAHVVRANVPTVIAPEEVEGMKPCIISSITPLTVVWDCTKDGEKVFWQQWEQYQDYLYHCCLKWMGGNPTEAEDALSRSMLKALEKVRDCTGVITNFKAWLTRLTYNICVDTHREYKRLGDRVENLEVIVEKGEEGLVSLSHTPESVALRGELAIIIHRAINDLPPRLREPFVLHFIEEKSYPDIAQELGISYNNLCKRISQARGIVQKHLTKYLSGFDDSPLDTSSLSDKMEKFGVQSFYSHQIIKTYPEITPSLLQKQRGFDHSLNYQVSAICLETLPHAWYHSPTPLGWS
jgi:RNA polymerase sigma-70 factor (ECF subfamily)